MEKKKKKTKSSLDLTLECVQAAKDFKAVLLTGEQPVTMLLYRKPELRMYRTQLYHFFLYGKPDRILLKKVQDMTVELKKERNIK